VHRLIRIPFVRLRAATTSFASIFVIPEIDDRIDIVVKPEEVRSTPFARAAPGARTLTKWKPRCDHAPSELASSCNARMNAAAQERELPWGKSAFALYELEIENARRRHASWMKPNGTSVSAADSHLHAPNRTGLIKDHRTKIRDGRRGSRADGDSIPSFAIICCRGEGLWARTGAGPTWRAVEDDSALEA